MTIALANLTGTEDVGQGSSLWTWSGGGTWTLTTNSCTNGSPVQPAADGTTPGETATGTCSLIQPLPTEYIHTLLQDPEGIYDDFVERYHTQSLSRLLCQNAAVNVVRGNGCILHNYEPLPTPKINQLVIPTGATRWSYCLLLADDERKNDIYTACDNGSRTMNLIFGSPITGRQETEHAIVLTVYVLPPRQLSPTSDVPPPGQRPEPPNPLPPGYVAPTPVDPNISRLWLIPVVDERYYWQFKHTETLSTTAASTETDYTIPDNAVDLLLGMAAGTNYKNPGVNTAYDEGISPSCLSNNDYENLPIVMDSILTHYGQRLVVDIGCWDNAAEKYKVADLESPPTGRTRFAVLDGLNSISVFNSSMQGKLGLKNCTWVNSTNATPSASAESLTVGKPFIVAGGVSSSYGTSENYKAYASTPSSVDIQTVAGTYVNKTPESGKYKTAPVTAIWRTEFASEPPSTLVTQIGVDYFYQFYRQFDFTFAGVQPWQQTYFDDYMVIRQTWNPKTCQYDAFTRVCSRQPNLTGEWVTGHNTRLQGKMIDDLLAAVNTKRDPSTGRVKVLRKKSNGDLTLSTTIYTLTNRFENISIDSGTYVKFEMIDGEWQLYAADCPGGSASSGSV
jgi:hypothetical protein